MAPEALRGMLTLLGERLTQYLEDLPQEPAWSEPSPDVLASLRTESLPEEPQPFDRLVQRIFEELLVGGVNPASPGSLSYINGGGLEEVALANLIISITNRFGGFWGAAPALAEVEEVVLRFVAKLLGLPEGTAGGVLLTGGSAGNLTGIVTARHERLRGELAKATLYTSDQMHHSVERAALIAGISSENIRVIEHDARFHVRTEQLAASIERDRADGFAPFCIVGIAGTTNTGAVDDLNALADLAERHDLWLHVDAAYGGFFAMTDRGRSALVGIHRADSVSLDPHKSLFFPFGSGCLLVRDADALRRAHELHSACVVGIAHEAKAQSGANYADRSIEQTREARGLRLWLPLNMLGLRFFREALDEKIDLARIAADELGSTPGVELVCRPELSVFAFRVTAPGLDGPALDGLTTKVLDAINLDRRFHLASAVVEGRVAIRFCVQSFRTHRPIVEACLDRIRAAVREQTDLVAKESK